MRLIPVGLLAGVLSLGLLASTGPAAADSRLAKGLTNLDGVQGLVEKATYYGYGRGYGRMFQEHIAQAEDGCDFDFLESGPATPEPEIH